MLAPASIWNHASTLRQFIIQSVEAYWRLLRKRHPQRFAMTAPAAPLDVLIVGAGLAGLCAARELQRAGRSICVLDKARGVGGRLASRRMGAAVLDHGAQYFTVRSEVVRNLLSGWFEDGTLQEWARGFALAGGGKKLDEDPRYIAPQGMNVLAKQLAAGLPVTIGAKVASASAEAARWVVHTEGGDSYAAHALLLTAPVPQSLELLAAGNAQIDAGHAAVLAGVEYRRCIALLACLHGPSAVPAPGGVWFGGEPVSWLADNAYKRTPNDSNGALTIHAGPEYSLENWDEPDEVVTRELFGAVHRYLGAAVRESQLQRWRYSQPVNPLAERCLMSSAGGAPVFFAGDAFGGPRVEGAILSGLEAAQQILALRLPAN